MPVCPHAGGVGLCEYVQHLAMIDYVCVSGSMEGRVLEYVDHLHEHFFDPVRDARRPLHAAGNAGLQHHHEAAEPGQVRISGRRRLGDAGLERSGLIEGSAHDILAVPEASSRPS